MGYNKTFIEVMLCNKIFFSRLVTAAEANDIRVARLGMQLGVAVYSMNPQKFKMWQTVLGVNLWKDGVSQKAFKALNRLGLCQSKDAARNRVDKIVEASDRVIQSCKHSLEVPILYYYRCQIFQLIYLNGAAYHAEYHTWCQISIIFILLYASHFKTTSFHKD